MRGFSIRLASALVAAAFGIGATSVGPAKDFRVGAQLPLKMKIKSVVDQERAGGLYTVATIAVVNGQHELQSLRISCEARNAKGFTWALEAKVPGLRPNEARDVEAVALAPAEPEGYSTNANTVYCEVSSFDGGIWLIEIPKRN